MKFHLEYENISDEDTIRAAYIPWDSDLFGMPFYELECSRSDASHVVALVPDWLGSLIRPSLVFTRLDCKAIELVSGLASLGFYNIETTLNLSISLGMMKPIFARPPAHLSLSPAEPVDIGGIMKLAHIAFSADRFHLEPFLEKELSNRRYSKWVERGFENGEPLFVCKDSRTNELIGFYLLRETEPDTVYLNLAAVDLKFQQTGLGAIMYQLMLQKCVELGYRFATTAVSINNLDVVNLFMRLGFSIRTAQTTMHLPLPQSSQL